MLVPWLFAPGATLKVYLAVVLVVSPICFVLYWLDKRRAIKQQVRISERTLHVAAFVGGWPGALLGQRVFHHKTQKRTFQLVFWLIVALHGCFLLLAIFGILFR